MSSSSPIRGRRFLSTPSSQRATVGDPGVPRPACDFYPRPLRRGRPVRLLKTCRRILFLSTPSSQRATGYGFAVFCLIFLFLSTPSSQRATYSAKASDYSQSEISIHTLFAEGDRRPCYREYRVFQISIHALFAEGDP